MLQVDGITTILLDIGTSPTAEASTEKSLGRFLCSHRLCHRTIPPSKEALHTTMCQCAHGLSWTTQSGNAVSLAFPQGFFVLYLPRICCHSQCFVTLPFLALRILGALASQDWGSMS